MFQPGAVGGAVGDAVPVGAEDPGAVDPGAVEVGAVEVGAGVPAAEGFGVEDAGALPEADGGGPEAGSEAAGAQAPSRTARPMTPPEDRRDMRLLFMGTSRTAADRFILRRSVHCAAPRCIRGLERRNRS